MALTIDLSPDVEARLHAEAAKRGIDTSGYIVSTLKALVYEDQKSIPQITGLEAELMQNTTSIRYIL